MACEPIQWQTEYQTDLQANLPQDKKIHMLLTGLGWVRTMTNSDLGPTAPSRSIFKTLVAVFRYKDLPAAQ